MMPITRETGYRLTHAALMHTRLQVRMKSKEASMHCDTDLPL